MHLLPWPHGFSMQVSIDVPTVKVAVDRSSAGSSMVVLVIRTLSVDDSQSVAPRSASLALNSVSRMVRWLREATWWFAQHLFQSKAAWECR